MTNNIKEHFDAIAKFYYKMVDSVWYDNQYYHLKELAFVLKIFSQFQNVSLHILDAGCGPGRHTIALAKLGHQVTAVDFSEYMLREAQSHAEEVGVAHLINFVQADVRALPFMDKTFDAIICIEVLEHLPGYLKDVEIALREFGRVLKSDGILIIQAPLKLHERLRQSHIFFFRPHGRKSVRRCGKLMKKRLLKYGTILMKQNCLTSWNIVAFLSQGLIMLGFCRLE